jgi:ABC-type antimicrobial peptide transport system permease subunit
LKTVLPGLGLGLTGAVIASRLIASELYGVRALDYPTFLGVAVLMILTSVVACSIPARRAAEVDPMVALRYE